MYALYLNIQVVANAFSGQSCHAGKILLHLGSLAEAAVDDGCRHIGLKIHGLLGESHAHGHFCTIHTCLPALMDRMDTHPYNGFSANAEKT